MKTQEKCLSCSTFNRKQYKFSLITGTLPRQSLDAPSEPHIAAAQTGGEALDARVSLLV